MATTPLPTPADVLATLQKGLDIKITASGQLPGEALLVSLFSFLEKNRETMSQASRDRFDAILAQQAEDMQHVGRGIWKALGVIE